MMKKMIANTIEELKAEYKKVRAELVFGIEHEEAEFEATKQKLTRYEEKIEMLESYL